MSSALVQMQKIASKTQLDLQKMTDTSTAKTFDFNSKEAAKSRDWQTTMSNTAHQREVKDLIAAGLNPVLSSGGSGSPAYTTSAASGSADNPAAAVASIMSSRLSGIAGISQTKMASAAQIKAAQESAAAMRAAAASNAWATKYAADKAYETAKYQTDNAKISNWAGLVDKYFHKFGIDEILNDSKAMDNVKTALRNLVNGQKNGGIYNNYKNPNNFSLKQNAQKQVNKILNNFNLPKTMVTSGLVVQSFVFNNVNAQRQLFTMIKSFNRKPTHYPKMSYKH